MSPNYPHLAQRLFNVPLAIHADKLEIIMAALADRFGLARLFRPNGETVVLAGDDFVMDEDDRAPEVGYEVLAGVACIPVQGTLVHKLGTLHPYSGMTGYDTIRANLSLALADPRVKAILLDVDSPGGEVSGCFDLVDSIYSLRGMKPVWAVCSETAYSAAFAIASAADRVVVPRTGGVGSAGVICAHVDFSRALDAAGINVTLITYGKHKADGNEFQPLSSETLARFQADVDYMGGLFCDTVARNLKMSVANVRKTEAGTFMGAKAVSAGFAHAVMSPEAAFGELVALIS